MLSGDQAQARAQIDAVADDVRRAMKIPDAARPIDPESARIAARTVPGVRSVAWIDRANLMVIVSDNDVRTEATIDAICAALSPLGDTLAVVVHLQSAAATDGDALEVLGRNCQLAQGDRAFLQADRQVDTLPPEIRAQVKAQRAQARESQSVDDAERRRQDEETRRILEAGTPEM